MLKGIRCYIFVSIAVILGSINSLKPETSYYGELSKRLLMADKLVKEQASHVDIKKTIHTGNLQEEALKASQNNEVPLDFTVKPMSKSECLALMMAVIPQTTVNKEKSVCTSWEELDKLNILSGTRINPNNSLISHLGISTVSGLIAGAEVLSEDTFDSRKTTDRQTIEQYLIAHPEVRETLKQAFEDIKEGEGFYWLYFQEMNKQLQQTLNLYYFSMLNTVFKKIGVDLNKNATALNISTGGTKLLGLLFLVPWVQLSVAGDVFKNGWEKTKNAPTFLGKLKEFVKLPFDAGKNLIDSEVLRHNPFLHGIDKTVIETTPEGTLSAMTKVPGCSQSLGDHMELQASAYRGQLGSNYYYFKPSGFLNKFKGSGPLLATLYFDFIYTMQATSFYTLEKVFHDIITHFHTKMIGIAKIVRALATINRIAEEANLPELNALVEPIRAFIETSNPEIKNLISNLHKDTFNKTSFFSNWGLILATNSSINEHKCALIDPLHAAGSFEALFAASTLVTSTQGQQAHYALANIICDNESPAITIKNSWNILVARPICNDITLGGKNPRFINATGPNMGGKSTIYKGFVQAIKLAQLGITNGDCEIHIKAGQETPIRVLVHVDETEDVSGGKSTFMAENEKLRNMVEKIENDPATLFLILEDEPLRGTVKDTAAKKLIAHLETLFKLKNACGFINTHLEEICSLEKLYPDTIANYFVNIDRTTFARLYTVSKGIPTWWFGPANEAFREAYIKHLEDEEKALKNSAVAVTA